VAHTVRHNSAHAQQLVTGSNNIFALQSMQGCMEQGHTYCTGALATAQCSAEIGTAEASVAHCVSEAHTQHRCEILECDLGVRGLSGVSKGMIRSAQTP
jgi:hypothetical protein